MRKTVFVFIICLFWSASVYAESDYIEHVTSFFDEVECRGINVYNEDLNFRLDSGEDTFVLNARAMPLNTTNRKLTYQSSNPEIISVDDDGTMHSMNKPGDVKITVSCGDVSREVTVSVIRGVNGLTLKRADMLFYADKPVAAKVEPIISPSDATNKNLTYKSEDTDIAIVDENGVITPCGVGTTNVIATTEDGGFKASCIVRVQVYNVPVRAVFLENAVDVMAVGSTYKLKPYLYPQNTKNTALTWESSDTSAVTVSADGVLTGVAEGMSVITCRAANGFEESFTITCLPNDGTPIAQTIISEPVADRIAMLTMPVFYSHYGSSFNEALSAQLKASPTVFTTNASSASKADVEKYLNPQSFTSGYEKYQFLDLSVSNGVTPSSLNTYFTGKGVLDGMGEVFRDAALANGISEIYLSVHAALESGNGSSELACGVEYNGTTVYNLFGIGAVDADPVNGGAKYAYEKGWTSIESAIYGGAKWISENYINNGQNTLYKMRWNPKSPGKHQYATDVAWAVKQARTIKPLIEACPDAAMTFEFPVYSGQSEVIISYE